MSLGNATAVAPLLVLAAGLVAVVTVDAFLRKRTHFVGRRVTPEWIGALLSLLTGTVFVVAAIVTAQNFVTGETHVFRPGEPRISFDPFASFTATWLCAVALLATLQGYAYLVKRGLCRGEHFALCIASVAGWVLALCSADLLTTFLGLELASLPLVALAGLDRRQLRSNEAALKWLLAAGLSSGVTAFGMALVFGATGATHYDAIREGLDPADAVAMAGVGLVIAGLAFRALLVPFHSAGIDAIDGAPSSTSVLLAVVSITAALCVGLRLTQLAFAPAQDALRLPLLAIAVLSMVWGAAYALVQERTQRFLGGLAIAQAGAALTGWTTAGAGASAMLFAAVAQGVALLGAFGVVMALAGRGGEADRVSDLDGLSGEKPWLALAMALFMLSLAGIPGTIGFVARFELWSAAFAAGRPAVAVMLALGSLLGLLACLRIPIALYAKPRSTGERRPGAAGAEILVLAAAALLVVVFGVFPNGGIPGLEPVRALDWGRDAVALFVAEPPAPSSR